MQFKKNLSRGKEESALQKIEKMHPHKMLLYFSMLASFLIFFFMILAYTVSMPDYEESSFDYFPKSFILSTIILILSSVSLSKALPAFKNDKVKTLERSLGITLMFGLLYALFQYIGWVQLTEAGIYFDGSPSGSYLYVISGLHLIHLFGGMVALTYMYLKSLKASKDPVKSLILITNPYQKLRLEILTTYWHFMDAIWMGLFIYFLFTF
jgi:cytochrome c oxidase subunit III